jgi:hypothetical protein
MSNGGRLGHRQSAEGDVYVLEDRVVRQGDELELRLLGDHWLSGTVYGQGTSHGDPVAKPLWPMLEIALGGAWEQHSHHPKQGWPHAFLQLHQDCILRWPASSRDGEKSSR